MILICSHDAGGAEILSSYVKQTKKDFLFVLDGPAIGIFEKKIGKIINNNLEKIISKVSQIICGSSWESNLELEAIKLARKNNIKSITFLDHWINYRERFLRGKTFLFPDEIWCGDKHSFSLAKNYFSDIKIKLVLNPYFKDIKNEIKIYSRKNINFNKKLNFLYVCEPIREHALKQYNDEFYWGYSEEDALSFFLKNISKVYPDINCITLRNHPSEKHNKYYHYLNFNDLPIIIDNKNNLLDSIIRSDIVVGCETMAMVIALFAGKKVFSSIPIEKECNLPFDKILKLRDLL